MIGKKIKVNDYKFTYGQETVVVNLYGAFKNVKNGNKYAIYSYNNNGKLCYGTFYRRNNEAVIMTSKENPKEIVKEFIDSVIKDDENDKFEIIALNEINSIQIIDEYISDFNVDIVKLYDLTIPKPIVKETAKEIKKKKPISIAAIFFSLFVIVVISFFFFNPEVIIGKDKHYSCIKTYYHSSVPASINEQINLTFSGKENIKSIDLINDYKFNDTNYYKEFKDKGYFYQYMEEGNTYKFVDESNTYRLFSKIDITGDFFLPTSEKELIEYYENNKYLCKVVEVDE